MTEATATQKIEEQPRKNGNIFQYAWDFNKHFWKDHKFQVRWNAISRGFFWMLQAAGLVLAFPGAPLALAGGAALAGIGALAIAYSIPKSWASMEGLFKRTFPKFNPLKRVRQRVAKMPLVQKIIQKNPFKNKRLLSPGAQDAFLSFVTLEGSVAAVVVATKFTVGHAVKLAATPVASILTLSTGGVAALTAGAALFGAWCAYDAVCCVKTLADIYKKHKKNKKALANKETPAPAEPALPMPEIKSKTGLTRTATPAFNTEAAVKEAGQQLAKQQAQAPSPSRKPSP